MYKEREGLLYIACQNGQERTAYILLKNGVEVNLCMDGSSSLL